MFPIKGKEGVPSLWSCFYPRSQMRWEWDEDGDDRVARLWHLRARLAESRQVVYSKWYQGRASVFKKALLPHLLVVSNSIEDGAVFENDVLNISRGALQCLSVLEESSPRSTRELKAELGLVGSSNESQFQKITKELFARFLIVGVGEIEDSSFPSLAYASTKLVFDRAWAQATTLAYSAALRKVSDSFGEDSAFFKQLRRHRARSLIGIKRHKVLVRLPKEILFEDL